MTKKTERDTQTEDLMEATEMVEMPPEDVLWEEETGSSRSLTERVYRNLKIALTGGYKGTDFYWRDRVVILSGFLAATVVVTTLTSILLDIGGFDSGPIWDVRVASRQLVLDAFGFIGSIGGQVVNNKILVLALGVLALYLITKR